MAISIVSATSTSVAPLGTRTNTGQVTVVTTGGTITHYQFLLVPYQDPAPATPALGDGNWVAGSVVPNTFTVSRGEWDLYVAVKDATTVVMSAGILRVECRAPSGIAAYVAEFDSGRLDPLTTAGSGPLTASVFPASEEFQVRVRYVDGNANYSTGPWLNVFGILPPFNENVFFVAPDEIHVQYDVAAYAVRFVWSDGPTTTYEITSGTGTQTHIRSGFAPSATGTVTLYAIDETEHTATGTGLVSEAVGPLDWMADDVLPPVLGGFPVITQNVGVFSGVIPAATDDSGIDHYEAEYNLNLTGFVEISSNIVPEVDDTGLFQIDLTGQSITNLVVRYRAVDASSNLNATGYLVYVVPVLTAPDIVTGIRTAPTSLQLNAATVLSATTYRFSIYDSINALIATVDVDEADRPATYTGLTTEVDGSITVRALRGAELGIVSAAVPFSQYTALRAELREKLARKLTENLVEGLTAVPQSTAVQNPLIGVDDDSSTNVLVDADGRVIVSAGSGSTSGMSPPTASGTIPSQDWDEGELINLSVSSYFTGAVQYFLDGAPSMLTIDSGGTIGGTISDETAGSYTITVYGIGANGLWATRSFAATVNEGLQAPLLAWTPATDGTIAFSGDLTAARGTFDAATVRDWQGARTTIDRNTMALEGGRWTGSAWRIDDGSGNLLRPLIQRNVGESQIAGVSSWYGFAHYRRRADLNSVSVSTGNHYFDGEGADRRYYTVTTGGALAASVPSLSRTIGTTGIADGAAVVTCSGYYTIEGFRMEPQAADWITRTDIAHTAWAKTNCTVGAADSDGMHLLTSTSAANNNRAEFSATAANSTVYTASVDIKAGTATTTRIAWFQNSAFTFTQDITWSGGTPTIGSTTGTVTTWMKKRMPGIWRVYLRFTTPASGTAAVFTLYPDRSTSQLTAYYGWPRVEASAIPSSPTVATGTTITRAADAWSTPQTWVANTAGTALVSFTPAANAAQVTSTKGICRVSDNPLYYHGTNGGIQFGDGTNNLGGTSPDIVRDKPKRVAAAWGAGSRLVEDGANIGSGSYDGSFGTATVRWFCGASGGDEFPSHVEQILSLPSELAQATLESITAFDA